MDTSVAEPLIERELDQLRKELSTLRSGVSYIEQAAALLRLCEQTVATLQDKGGRSMDRLEEAYVEVADGVKAANGSAQALECLVHDMQAHPLASLLEAHEGQLEILQGRLECLAKDSQETAVKTLEAFSYLGEHLDEQIVTMVREHGRISEAVKRVEGQVTQVVEDQGHLLQELGRTEVALAQGNRETIQQAESELKTALADLKERFSEEAKHTRSLVELHGKSLELLEGKLTGRLVGLGRLVLGALVLGAATLGWLVFLRGR